ncbi:hypothetical protein [Pontibacter sp. SGAir0037]|uniref:hypothetical protein n=1 Tax=Pontibacter sp. SGAir0037 TaxID=2571030 RepID=UPI0010CCD9A6|nr:hypothetical protein [Pontibacter sp. SGAir0037]QCR24245.1 hypothetical protein C1N53_19045 [Pontibacter sp. SGAir0037]
MLVPQFIFGKGLFLIKNKGEKDELQANIRGIESMVTLYTKIKAKDKRAKNKTLEKYEGLVAKNTLEAYVRKQMRL